MGLTPAPNDVYLFAGLLLRAVKAPGVIFSFLFADEDAINGLTRNNVVHLSRIGMAHYASVAGAYDLLPCGATLGRGVGPVLLANTGESGASATFDPERETLSPGASTTAQFLLEWYANRPVQLRHPPPTALYRRYLCNRPGAQGVVVGEERFTYQNDGLTLLADLGEAWEARTGRAVPLGVIGVRKSLGKKMAGTIATAISRSLEWADQNPEIAFNFCGHHASATPADVLRAYVGLYVNDFAYDLGDEGNAAVQFFLEEQRRFAENQTAYRNAQGMATNA